MNNPAQTIEGYIATFPKETQKLLQQVRRTIAEVAPQAQECINYGMPTFRLNGNLVHFAGYKNHIGFYPAPLESLHSRTKFLNTNGPKVPSSFHSKQLLPLDLIKRITLFRVKENTKN